MAPGGCAGTIGDAPRSGVPLQRLLPLSRPPAPAAFPQPVQPAGVGFGVRASLKTPPLRQTNLLDPTPDATGRWGFTVPHGQFLQRRGACHAFEAPDAITREAR